MSTEPDPQLLSLLEKTANPIQTVNLNVSVKGVFAPPEQWKATDEANPNIFTYTLKVLNRTINSGKIQPKTGADVGKQDDKNKKGGKKEVKEEQKPPVEQDPQILKLQAEWDALPEEEKFYRTSEDPEKMFSLQFPQKDINEQLTGESLNSFEQLMSGYRVEVILTRKPQLSEEDLAKLKKSKPKNLNLGELYEAKYRGTLDISVLGSPGQKDVTQRVKLTLDEQIPAEMTRIEAGECYAFVQVHLDTALLPEVTEVKPQLQEVLPNVQNLSRKGISIIQKLKRQITRAIKAINQEYTTFFSKEKDFQDDKRNTGFNSVSTLRLNEISKRKDLFLTEFVNSGKFNILKDRVSHSLKAVIVDKFKKQKQSGPISKEQIHKTLSELNLFFHEFIQKTIDYVLTSENSTIHEDILINYESQKAKKKQSVAPIVSQSKEQQEKRIADEYETVNNCEKTKEKYLNLVLLNGQSIQSLKNYADFCCRNHQFDTAYAIFRKIVLIDGANQNRLRLCLFMVQRGRVRDALESLTELIQSESSSVDEKILYNNLLSFMYEVKGDIRLSEKYLALAEKYFKIKKNPYLKINPVPNPYAEPKPLIPKPERYTSQLTAAESQEMLGAFVEILEEGHFYDLISKLLKKLEESHKKTILKIKVLLFEKNHDEALEKLDELLEKSPNDLSLLEMKADICYRFEKIFQVEEVFLLILRQKPGAAQSEKALLRLGYIYLNRKSWEDAKVTFEKVCELKSNCSLGWLGLGKALLELKQLKEAEQAFSMSSVYNPLSTDPQANFEQISEFRKTESDACYKYITN